MTIKEAMQSYFVKLEHLYRQAFGTLSTVSWDTLENRTKMTRFNGNPKQLRNCH